MVDVVGFETMVVAAVTGAWACFFFNDTATTEIYTLSLHDALPISGPRPRAGVDVLSHGCDQVRLRGLKNDPLPPTMAGPRPPYSSQARERSPGRGRRLGPVGGRSPQGRSRVAGPGSGPAGVHRGPAVGGLVPRRDE